MSEHGLEEIFVTENINRIILNYLDGSANAGNAHFTPRQDNITQILSYLLSVSVIDLSKHEIEKYFTKICQDLF